MWVLHLQEGVWEYRDPGGPISSPRLPSWTPGLFNPRQQRASLFAEM
jgi:hypothetical protein